jgi:hypothetical protein
MRAFVALSLAAVLAAPVPQQAPNFAGRWSEQAAPGPAGRGPRSGDMGSGWGNPITITQNAAQLTVEYAFFGRGDMQAPLRFVYALDGTETVNTVMMGRGMEKTKARTAWNGASLIITTMHDFADPTTGKTIPVEVKRVLSLRAADTLAIETTRAGVLGAQAVVTRTTLVRVAQ